MEECAICGRNLRLDNTGELSCPAHCDEIDEDMGEFLIKEMIRRGDLLRVARDEGESDYGCF